ncbi:hypothetical protein [Modicisalibacter luteus]|uniref:Uncharacterized protein n=1 Tax=Modicisalibacter luteus TaxID=453962 RepID=A0ABV7LWM5_9GAMM|nr:hypothetical protein [Halomonas lutea]GHB13872.1 hypothetical protein GCM10007159_40250 [Halomonas lutea]
MQPSGAKSGGSHNDHYVPVIKCMEREQPSLAAIGHWPSINDTGETNQYLDDVVDMLLTPERLGQGLVIARRASFPSLKAKP